jgi:GNAT superfamily N-acetyltransferase
MVFWKDYPIDILIKTKINRNVFRGLQFEREHMTSPTGICAKLVDITDNRVIKELCLFLKSYFGNPPKTPIFDIPENKLLLENDLLLYIEDKNDKIIGCIRVHYLGIFKNQDIYCVDCFCIHPDWRRKGVGDYLLNEIHIISNKENKLYSMFLKEGRQLSIIHTPFYSGIYVFKKIINEFTPHIMKLSTINAYRILDIFNKFNNNDLFIIKNINNDNQSWMLYKNGINIVLACIQDTYQYLNENNKKNKMCWITAWIESPHITSVYREEAIKEISASVYPEFEYIWANKEWIGDSSHDWKIDGPFHWYLYQWTTNINIKKSYCILN